jgi:hypothetical protein
VHEKRRLIITTGIPIAEFFAPNQIFCTKRRQEPWLDQMPSPNLLVIEEHFNGMIIANNELYIILDYSNVGSLFYPVRLSGQNQNLASQLDCILHQLCCLV